MKKREFNYEQIVIGLLKKFGSIDVDDISVLMDMMKIDSFLDIKYSDFSKYIMKDVNERVVFNINTINRSFESIEQFYLVLENYMEDFLKNYLQNIDLKEFVLRKFEKLGDVSSDKYNKYFSNMQIFVINYLCMNGFLFHNYEKNENYKVTKLTKKGNLYLFLIDNKELINNFCDELENNGYNVLLVESFLMTQDLKKNIDYIEKFVLTIESFLNFCGEYDINPGVINKRALVKY